VDVSRTEREEHTHTVRIRSFAMRGEAWSWCKVRKTSLLLSRAGVASLLTLKPLPTCHAWWSNAVSCQSKLCIVP
jgi:hypothetical protein